jgi:hypothetical protein
VLLAASPDGVTWLLQDPLQYTHEANTFSYPQNSSITIAAEVALLTQSVKVQGDDTTSDWNQYGAQIMLHTAAGLPVVGRIENVELSRMGQGYGYGRYPLNFDVIGDASASYVKRVSLHDSYNRGLVLHGVSGLTLDGNVVYNVMGHGYMTEDASEQNNVITNCLAITIKPSFTLTNDEITPAAFWISNPANIVTGCAAVGSAYEGLAFYPAPTVTGASAAAGIGAGICPVTTPFLQFSNNVAHSNGWDGMLVYAIYTPLSVPCDPTSVPVTVTFDRITSYRNLGNGLTYTSGAQVSFSHFAVADNGFAGMQFANAGGGIVGGPWVSSSSIMIIIIAISL